MKKSLGLLLLSFMPLVIGEGFGTTAVVQAGETCNYINNNLYMAQAYQNANRVWVSQGWWIIEPGHCVVYGDNASTYFKIEEDVAAPRPTIPQAVTTDLCVVNDRFIFYQANDAGVCDSQDGGLTTFTNIGSNKELLQASEPSEASEPSD